MGIDRTNILRLHNKIVAAGIPIHGVNSNRIIDFNNATAPQQIAAQAIADGFEVLVVASDKLLIAANNVEIATITCNDAAILGDVTLDYNIYDDVGELQFAGNVPVAVGIANLTVKTALPGKYTIELARQGAYQTGSVIVEAI